MGLDPIRCAGCRSALIAAGYPVLFDSRPDDPDYYTLTILDVRSIISLGGVEHPEGDPEWIPYEYKVDPPTRCLLVQLGRPKHDPEDA